MGKLNCINKLKLFENLSEDELVNVASFCTKKVYQPGEFLFFEHDIVDKIYIVSSGRIKLSKLSASGKELTLGFAITNAVFGEEALFSDELYTMNGEVIDESCITICSKDDMEELFLNKPQIAVKVIRSLSRKLSHSTKQMSDLAFRNVRDRLLSTLQNLAENYGHKTDGGWMIDFQLTHNELASIINASRVTVTHTLTKLRDEGLVTIDDRQIILHNLKIS
ncbi:MAG: Crp/Fnr family transcriptional regulator [bacterium]